MKQETAFNFLYTLYLIHMYVFLCTLTMAWFSRRVYNFLSLLLQAPDICRAKNIFVLSLDEIIENNIALAVFIGKYSVCADVTWFLSTYFFPVVKGFFFFYINCKSVKDNSGLLSIFHR